MRAGPYIGYDADAELLQSLVYAYRDLPAARGCLRALTAMRTEKSRTQLLVVYFIVGPSRSGSGRPRNWRPRAGPRLP